MSASVPALPVALAACLAAVHVFAGRLRVLSVVPRSRWLSIAGGAAVAYVFVHLLPEVGAAAAAVAERRGTPVVLFESHVYLAALAGFVVFYGLERYAVVRGSGRDGDRAAERRLEFLIHVGSFAGYNALIGYLLVHREDPSTAGLVLFAVAMGLHLFVNDFGLRDHYGGAYHRIGRWLLAAAVLVGVAVGAVTEIDEATLAFPFAFLAGGIVLNVVKEELPEKRESRFGAFALGAGTYAALLLLV